MTTDSGLVAEVEDLHTRLAEAEETVRAIREGETDALVIAGDQGDEVRFLGGGERIYRQFIEAMGGGTALLSSDGTILSCNTGLATTLQRPLDQVVGTAMRDHLSPEDRDAITTVALSDARSNVRKIRLLTSEGHPVQVYLSATILEGVEAQPVFDLTFTNLAEVVSAEKALEESESQLKRVMTEAPVPMMVHAEDGEVLAVNRAWVEISGYSQVDIPSIADWTEKAYGKRIGLADENIDGAYGITDRTEEGERTIRTASGEQRVWDFCSAPLGTLPDGRRTVTSTARDITEHKRDERRLEQTTRALLTLSACNEALVREKDERSLLYGICNVAVTQGSYLTAWIGYAEHDEAKSIRRTAFAGPEEGYFGQASSWGDSAAEWPSGLAIRERTPIFARDARHDARFPSLREAAVAHGYESVAALPLVDSRGTSFGVFVLVATEPDAFDVDEMNLLQELTTDLAYGIESLQSERKRTEAENGFVVANEHLRRLFVELTEMVGRVVEARDPYTSGHQKRVAIVAVALAKQMGLDRDITESVRVAALVHDVGKMFVPAEILSKPGRLSEAEYLLIKEHPLAGFNILKGVSFEWPIAEMVLQHHERMDGSGYPNGLQGDHILIESRVLAVADVVEAMSSHRPYRSALGVETAVAEISSGSGKYDPVVVQACQSLYETGRMGL